ncbi:RluA family pseudouridine synthase [Clostridium sp. OF03-18AA]|uniref:RluA family pseudouridine synthase n=1 Tax=Pilosibacter sp. HC1M1C21 TaxID=3378803 RepID=UPI000E4796AD|nr:RluA family pseudouridine synthase [Clostridium sp. OF03-18AA]RHP67171.1 RluA family pseudouridine synthase [Clostridium sp. OF03-18AA]
MNVILTYKITESESGRSIAAFLLDSGYSSRLVVHLRNTAESFFLNGKTVFSNTVLQPEDCLDVHVTEKKASEQIVPVPADLSVVYEDEHVLVIDKPAGMPVHPSQGHYENTLANAIAWYYRNEETPFVFRAVNRLDRDTSGLILLAKNPYSSCILSDAVKDHAIHREYAAIVSGKTADSGTIDLPIARKDGSTIERVCDPERGDAAVTHYQTIAYNKDADLSFIRLLLETGRTHQIRVHMKAIGHPLPGDFLYCPDYRLIDRQPLHSTYLSFSHPATGEKLEFSAPLPQDMQNLFPDIKNPEGPVF